MAIVSLTGWDHGLQKLKLDRLLQNRAGLGLAAAKARVDGLLVRERVEIDVPDEDVEAFIAEALRLAANCDSSHIHASEK